jgi:hypothetical protein
MATNDFAGTSASRPQVDAKTLWSGGAATAVVAALVVLVGVLVSRGLFDVPVMAPEEAGTWGNVTTGHLVLLAAGSAIVATGLLHLLLLTTPRALSFFGWIIGLATVAVTIAPFAQDAELTTQIASAAIYLLTGIAIGTLLASVGGIALRRGSGGKGPQPDSLY